MEANFSFKEEIWRSESKFTCYVESASTNEENRTLSFNLKLIGGRSSEDVQAVVFNNCSLPVFPLNLTKTFPNLTVLQLTDCELTEISKTDLIGLEGLVELRLEKNKLQSLPSDLLADMKKLKWIWLQKNIIQHLDSKMFEGIKNQLEVLNLNSNVNINEWWHRGKAETFDEFMEKIDSKCQKPVKESPRKLLLEIYDDKSFSQKTSKIFKDLWLTRQFSDFTIVVGEARLSVHRAVLALQSKEFAAMFEDDVHERTISYFSSAAFEEFLCFLYTGKIQSELHAIELFSIAAKYDIADLKSLSEGIILNNVDESNALQVLFLAKFHDSEVLMKTSFEFVKRAYPEIRFNDTMMKKPDAVRKLIKSKEQLDSVVEEARQILEEMMDAV